jgi:hypothetical protein
VESEERAQVEVEDSPAAGREAVQPDAEREGGIRFWAALAAILAAVAGLGLAAPVLALVAFASLVGAAASRLRGAGLGKLPVRAALDAAVRLTPHLFPLIVYWALVLPLHSEGASITFFQQATEIIPILLIGFVLEAGALELRGRSPVDWLLGFTTVAILIVGETYALIALAQDDPVHADIVTGAMAAGAAAIVVAAAMGRRTS